MLATPARAVPPLLVLSAALWAAACGDGPGEPVGPPTAAVALFTCGPTDGSAVEIVLAPSEEAAAALRPPYVSVAIWRARDDLAGRTWVLTDGRDGSATRHPSAASFEFATRATATVRQVAPDGTVEGTVDLTFPNAPRVRQAFRAPWRQPPHPRICG